MNNRLIKYKYPGAKRLMLEAQEMQEKTEDYYAAPLDDNLFEWHFTVRGPPETAFDGGFYHGRLSFPTDYPMKPPSIILLTPNGRFETNKKICLSISGYHPETWQPSWSVRTALLALIAFMPSKANRAIGSLDFSDAEREKLARRSRSWSCETCGLIKDLLKAPGRSHIEEDNCPSGDCGPSTSRVADESTSSASTNSNKLQSIKGRGSGKSDSNNLKDSQDTTNKEDGTNSAESQEKSTSVRQSADTHQRHSSPGGSPTTDTHIQNGSNGVVAENLTDRRRAYSSLVFKSIFILLSLLILRRVVMVIQS